MSNPDHKSAFVGPLKALPTLEIRHDHDSVQVVKGPHEPMPSTTIYDLFVDKVEVEVPETEGACHQVSPFGTFSCWLAKCAETSRCHPLHHLLMVISCKVSTRNMGVRGFPTSHSRILFAQSGDVGKVKKCTFLTSSFGCRFLLGWLGWFGCL